MICLKCQLMDFAEKLYTRFVPFPGFWKLCQNGMKINLQKPNKRIRRLIQFKLEQYGLNQEVKEVQTHVIDDTSNRNQELPYVDIRLGRGSRFKKNPTSLLIDGWPQNLELDKNYQVLLQYFSKLLIRHLLFLV